MAYIKKDRRDDEQRGPKREARGGKREGGPSTPNRDRKPYGDKPERRSSSSDRGDKKPYEARGPKREGGSSAPNRDRDGDRRSPRPYGDRPKSYGDKPERRSSSSDRGERKPYGERGASAPNRDRDGDRRSPKPYGDRSKPYGDKPERRSSSSDRGDRKPYGDRPKPNERGSSYSNRPLRSSDEPRDRSAGHSAPREVARDGYKPRSKKTFDEKPSRGRPERRTKSDKITPHKPGAFDVFDKRYAKPNIKEEIKKERKESRERKEENYRERREYGTGARGPSAPLRDREEKSRDREVGSSATPRERKEKSRDREVGSSAPLRDRKEKSRDREIDPSAPLRERGKREEKVEQYEGYDRKKTAPDEEIRLNRFIANSGVCSRRKADELIEKGEITINGEVVRELGYKVKYTDKIKYDGKLLKPGKLVYVLLNKPKDYITTMDDPEERRTVVQLTAKATNERIFPVGRLDRNTTGLLLLTNDGDLADKLAHPRNQVKKVYEVELDKSLSTSDFEIIKNGVELEDGPAKPDQISYLEGKSKKFLGIEIHIGRNRIVRRIFESLGYEVVRLDRVIYAGLSKKDLPRGRHRMLTKEEIIYLKHLNKY